MAKKKVYLKYLNDIPENWENQYGWYYYADAVRIKTVGTKTLPKIKKGKQSTVYHCEKCNKQWQCNWINPTSKRRTLNYYFDLPTYGLKRKMCEKCEEKEQKIDKLNVKIKEYFGLL